MYIALQWCGLLRGFRIDRTRELILHRIIKRLEEQGYEVHIFCHTYDIEYDDIINNLNKHEFNIKKIVVDSDKKIQDYLEKEYKLEKKYKFPNNWIRAANKNDISYDVGVDYKVSETYHNYGWVKFSFKSK